MSIISVSVCLSSSCPRFQGSDSQQCPPGRRSVQLCLSGGCFLHIPAAAQARSQSDIQYLQSGCKMQFISTTLMVDLQVYEPGSVVSILHLFPQMTETKCPKQWHVSRQNTLMPVYPVALWISLCLFSAGRGMLCSLTAGSVRID